MPFEQICSMSMTPFLTGVNNAIESSLPIHLADKTVVNSTHRGISSLLLGMPTDVKTLVFPDLHEPLLSIAALCNKLFTVVFNATSCCIFKSLDTSIKGTVVGSGYRKGNLFYLPSQVDVSFPFHASASPLPITTGSAACSMDPRFDSTLLGYHNVLSHIGL
jgi:hypothetical protein